MNKDESSKRVKKQSEKQKKPKVKKQKSDREKEKIQTLEREIEQLKKEKEEFQDRYLRLAAEFDNYKKLSAKEIEAQLRGANEALILEILPVLDDFDRTLDAIPTSKETKSIRHGVEMVRDNMKKVLGKHGLEEFESVGKEFNVDYHEALMMVKDKKYPENAVVHEHQKGYKINGRVIRHAKVSVNKPDD